MKYFLLVFLFIQFFSVTLFSQSSFRKLSRPEKWWVLTHPIKARKAQVVTQKVQLVVDSVRKNGSIGSEENGGKLDAFKHAYWMASLACKIGPKQALKLGKAHERGNYLQFKKQLLEDKSMPDSVSSVMDLRNNAFGVSVAENNRNSSAIMLQKLIMDGFATGQLVVLKKDEEGNYLTCDGRVIHLDEWKGKWNVPKCVVPSMNH